MDLNKLCTGLTLEQRDELFQIAMSYVDSIDKTFTSSIDIVCIGCGSGVTRKLTYSKTNGTRCATCKASLSPDAPKIVESTVLPLLGTLSLCTGKKEDAVEEEFSRIEIQTPLVYDPNVLPSSSSSLGRGQFLRPGGL
jgi:hypothetical protein